MKRLNHIVSHLAPVNTSIQTPPLPTQTRSILFHNGKICSSFEQNDQHWTWMIIENEKVKQLGDKNPPTKDFRGTVEDLKGSRVIPGLIDSHIHVHALGKLIDSVLLEGTKSIEELQARVTAYRHARVFPSQDVWIEGGGWEQHLLGRYPTRYDLDKAVNDRPIALWRVCHHIIVVNSEGLKALGIKKGTTPPVGGVIDCDDSGEPTGVLRENAAYLVEPFLDDKFEDRIRHILAGLNHCLDVGITAVQTNEGKSWAAYQALVDRKQMPIRVFNTINAAEIGGVGVPLAHETYGPLLSCHRVKIFADGALGGQTAAISIPYRCAHNHNHKTHDKPKSDNLGVLLYETENLNETVLRATKNKYRVEIHVIGDRAAEQSLNAIQYSTDHGYPPIRPIFTHCQVLRKDLIERMQKLSVIANVQPQFVITDSAWAEEFLDSKLFQYSYAWKTLLHSHVAVAGGSDAPVEIPDPFLGLHAAIFRPSKQPGKKVFRPEECLTKAEAFYIYTEGGAYASGTENYLGKLKPDYFADFVIIEEDIWEDPTLLEKAKPQQVWVHGMRSK